MARRIYLLAGLLVSIVAISLAGQRLVVSLKDFSRTELKSAGFTLQQETTVKVKALGAAGDRGWGDRGDELFAYAWIINADSRDLVWLMDRSNTNSSGKEREFDATIPLPKGSYEIYFTAATYSYDTWLSAININIDHREKPLFGAHRDGSHGFFDFFRDWVFDDVRPDFETRSKKWGVELSVDDSRQDVVTTFTPPKEIQNTVFKATGLGEYELIKSGISLSNPTTMRIYAIGEGRIADEYVDFGWIVNAADRTRVWEMRRQNARPAGGSSKNIKFSGDVELPKGEYVIYFVTDDSHSMIDWNTSPPYDPLNYGITLSVRTEREKQNVKILPYDEDKNLIVQITKVKDDESRTEGFTLTDDARVRMYGFGERGNSRRQMVDYAYLVDAKTRNRIWTMDIDRTVHGGGGSKNRFVDEVISLSKGSYLVTYKTDDSHSYNNWNVASPFDPQHYGISIMGVGENFKSSIIGKYTDQRDNNVVARITRVADDANEERKFTLDRTTRLRVYAIGEGMNREMHDYGWIEDTRKGNIVWEMTYSMTTHAGGNRKNRTVNNTILLDKGEYKLRFRTDDSHAYRSWNATPPEDPDSYGITIYQEDVGNSPESLPR